jgi:hypothetical protein
MQTAAVWDLAGTLLLAFPFAIQVAAKFRFLSLGGYAQPYRGIPSACDCPPEAYALLGEVLASLAGFHGIRLGPVEDSDASVHRLLAALVARGWMATESSAGAQFMLRLPTSFPDLLKRSRASFQKTLAYNSRKIRRDGKVEITHFNGTDRCDWAAVLGTLADVESKSWLPTAGGSLRFVGDRNQMFWRSLLATPVFADMVHAWVLHLDDRPVSYSVALDAGRCRFFIANGYDEAVASYMTGAMLYTEMFADSIARGYGCANLGHGDSGYKGRWGARPEGTLREHVLFRPGLLGMSLYVGLGVGHLLGGIRQSWQCSRLKPIPARDVEPD